MRATLGIAAAVAAYICGPFLPGQFDRAHAQSGPVSIHGAGATFPAPLYKLWIDSYGKARPDVRLSYDGVGSGQGISRFVAGSVHFGASDAAISDKDMDRVERGVITIPATAGMVVLAYNVRGLDGALKLPRDVYVDILLGKVKTWDDPRLKQVNPSLSLPNRNIAVVARLDGSGTTFALANHLSAVSEAWRRGRGVATLIEWPSGTMLAKGNEGVAARIKVSEGSIGYVEYGFAKRLGLPVAELENKSGKYVMPDTVSAQSALLETVASMNEDMRATVPDPAGPDSYPIVTYSWLLLYRQYPEPRMRAALADFVTWGLTEGQVHGAGLGYIPLPGNVVARGLSAVRTIQ